MRPLGKTQQSVLKALVSHYGHWSRASGWVWTTANQTERILQSLEKRGLVTAEPGPATVFGDGTIYRATDKGRETAQNESA